MKKNINIKLFFLIVMNLVFCFNVQSQILKKVNESSNVLSKLLGSENEVTEVSLVSETDLSCTIQIFYKGFSDVKYVVKAQLLNRFKRSLSEVKEITSNLSKKGSSVDLEFSFKPKAKYKTNFIEAKYLAFVICPEEDNLCDLDSGVVLKGTSEMYFLKKKFDLNGCEDCDVTPQNVMAKLIPYKSSSRIKQ